MQIYNNLNKNFSNNLNSYLYIKNKNLIFNKHYFSTSSLLLSDKGKEKAIEEEIQDNPLTQSDNEQTEENSEVESTKEFVDKGKGKALETEWEPENDSLEVFEIDKQAD
jgi:hypothetical protein